MFSFSFLAGGSEDSVVTAAAGSALASQARLQLSRSTRRVARGAAGLADHSKWTAVLPLQPYVQAHAFDSVWEWMVGNDMTRLQERSARVSGCLLSNGTSGKALLQAKRSDRIYSSNVILTDIPAGPDHVILQAQNTTYHKTSPARAPDRP